MKALRLLFVPAAMLALLSTALADPSLWRRMGWKTDFSKATIPLSEILSGGPPRDGIPPIDRPMFKPVAQIDNLAEREPMILYPLDAKARAYPLRVMTWHEIANDTVAGLPVAVTYCPLCNAALVFDRRVAGRVLDFGTSGLLRNSDLVMWDRQTETWWQQFTGEAIVGALTGASLKMLPSRIVSFGEFRKRWPGGQVLVPENPGMRPYGRNPYVSYDKLAATPFLFRGELPKGLPAMARVAVARTGKGQVAVALALLAERNRVTHEGVTFAWRPGQASALDTAEIAKGRDVGSVEVTDANGEALVHDITFAFVFHAFTKDAAVLTGKGMVDLASGRVVGR